MRLDKFICHHSGISRAEAKRVLRQDLVTCNGEVIRSGAYKVTSETEVELDGQLLGEVKKRYIMLNKVADTICSTVDEEYPSIINFLDELPNTRGLHIAGRLDVDTTGLVLITDDGQWSHQITSPKKQCAKRYRVWLAEPLCNDAEQQVEQGIQLRGEDELTKPGTLERIDDTEVLLTIIEGKYHQVKRMFAAVGNRVVGLHREQIGEIVLDENLAEGQWRYLEKEEIAQFI